MFSPLLTPLVLNLRSHLSLSKSRLETLAILVTGIVNCRTVNLSHVASQFPGSALHASSYRRLQRFFQYVYLDPDRIAGMTVDLLKLQAPYFLQGLACRPGVCRGTMAGISL